MALTGTEEATLVDLVWDEGLTGATHNVPTSAGRRLRQLADIVMYDGTLDAATISTVTLPAGSSGVADFYDHMMIVTEPGTANAQARLLKGYVSGTRVAGVHPDFKTNPGAVLFQLLAWSEVHVHYISDDVITESVFANGAITAAKAPNLDAAVSSRAASGALDATALDATAVAEIVAGILAAQYTGTKTLQSLLVLLRAHAAGVSTGHPGHPIFTAPDGTTPILEADVDANGNRSAVDAHGG